MQTRKTLHNNIINHTRALLFKLGISGAEIMHVVSAIRSKDIHSAIHLIWRLLDQLEPDYPHASADFMQARIELHAIQDDYYLLESQQLSNKISLLTAKLNEAERDKQRITHELQISGNKNAALLLALRQQQQLTAHLRSQLEQTQHPSKERNPHSPYMSPSFAHSNDE